VLRFVRLAGIALASFLPAGGLLVASSTGASGVLIAAVAAAALALALGWPALTGVPRPGSARLVLAGTGALAIALAATGGASDSAVLVAVGLGFPAAFVRELARPAPRPDLVRSVTATACGVMAVAATGLWVVAARLDHFQDLAIVAGCGTTAACLALGLSELLPAWRAEAGAGAGVVLAAAAGAAISGAVGTPWWAAAGVAAACGVAPGALWLVGEARAVFTAGPRLRDAALIALPLAVASVPVWAAQLMR
jgi:hypothetical protein